MRQLDAPLRVDLVGTVDVDRQLVDLVAVEHANAQRLQPLDDVAWTFLDSEIDDALSAVRASTPDPAAETSALSTLAASLTP